MKQLFFFGCMIGMLFSGCQNHSNSGNNYKHKINAWHRQRVEQLTQPDSWLSVTGLYWLQPGVNTFGSDSTNDLIFPGKAPSHIGKYIVKNDAVWVQIADNVTVTVDSQAVERMKVKIDTSSHPTVLTWQSLRWYIIERSDELAVRLKDSKSEKLINFKGIKRFPVDKKWKVKATFHPFNQPKKVKIPTVTGRPATLIAPGMLKFKLRGQTFQLRPLKGIKGDDKFFVIFGDKTNGEQTYGGCRFLKVPLPDEYSITYIDFNKAYSPP